MRFMHLADVHLGFNQYHSEERGRDFARAFVKVCYDAVERLCNLVLISGDLFHKTTMDPRTWLQAVGGLDNVRDAGIQVLAIAGNHDRAWRSDGLNWLHALDELGYLQLLDVSIEGGQLELGPRSIYETDEIRVVGIPYIGMGLPHIIPQLAGYLAALARKFTVLLLHAGLEGEMPGFRASLSMESLGSLRGLVDYVALGHLHKPFERDGWVYNPGSLETVSIDEAQWEDRGYFVVDVEDAKARVERVPTERRAFVQVTLGVDTFSNPEALYSFHADTAQDHALVRAQEIGQEPVVEFRLQGVLRFERASLDIARIEQIIEDAFQPLLVRIRDMTESVETELTAGENLTRAELERQVVRGLVERDAQREPHAGAWTETILELRDMALRKTAPGRVIEAGRAFRRKLQEEEN